MYFFIINNQSGKGTSVWKTIVPILISKDIHYKAYFITEAKDMHELELELNSLPMKGVIIVGGDGTVHHALKLLKNRDIPMGIIPAGSGNDFSRALNLPQNSKKALHQILTGKSKAIDLIYIDEEPCATIVGVGFDAKVAEIANRSKLKKWLNTIKIGKIAYIYGIFRGIFSYKPTTIEINVDDKQYKFSNVWFMAIANTPYYGGGLKICPEANFNDGQVDICVAHSLSKIELLMFFPLVFLGKHTIHRSVETFKGKNISISSHEIIPVQADGEQIGTTPLCITIKRKALKIIT